MQTPLGEWEHLKLHLRGKVVIAGIGNTLQSDDGAGSLLAARLQGKVSCTVYDTGSSPENYLGKIIRDKPETIILADAVDFGGAPGAVRIAEPAGLQQPAFFGTHNASLSMAIGYLQSQLKADIILLMIQPKTVRFGDTVSAEVAAAVSSTAEWFYEHAQQAPA